MGKYASNTEHMGVGGAAVIHTCTEHDNIRWIINNTEGSVVTVLGDLINYFLRVKP